MKKLENRIQLGDDLDLHKCLICGLRLLPHEKGLCSHCGDPRTRETIIELWRIVTTELSGRETIDVTEAVFSFLQNIGALGTIHPYLKRINC